MAAVLVFGKFGQVASSLEKLVALAGHGGVVPGGVPSTDWAFVGSNEANFESPEAILKILDSYMPRIVINCAAFTAVDKAEAEREIARAINSTAPGVIADWCAKKKASLIHFSTDYVYPGTGERPWFESDPVGPLNEYGASKLEGELKIVRSGCHHVVLRTSWVYAPEGNNFVRTMLRLGAERESLAVVGDQVGSPTSALDLAQDVLQILAHENFQDRSQGGLLGREPHEGIFHLAGSGTTTWYEFALEIFKKAKELGILVKVKDVRMLKTAEYPTPAVRPLNSRLDQTKIRQAFAVKPHPWRESVDVVLQEIFARDVGR